MSTDGDFQRAFVAMSYFLGARGPALLEPLQAPARGAEQLARRLSHQDKQERALALADELAKLARALKARALR